MAVTVRDIINAIPARFDASAAGEWKAEIQFNFSTEGDGEESYCISVGDGTCKVTEGKVDTPTCTVKTEAETWIGMTTGSIQPMQAFMTGKLKIEGNMGDVMKLNNPQIFKREKQAQE